MYRCQLAACMSPRGNGGLENCCQKEKKKNADAMTIGSTMRNKSPLSQTQGSHVFYQPSIKLWQANFLVCKQGKKKKHKKNTAPSQFFTNVYILLLPSETFRLETVSTACNQKALTNDIIALGIKHSNVFF